MIFWFGVGAGIGLMLCAQLVVEAHTPRSLDFPRNLPPRLDIVAAWGRVRTSPPPVPAAWDTSLDWLKCQLSRVEDWFDPFRDWDTVEWWRETFYSHVGRHRTPPKDPRVKEWEEALSWDRHTTQWLTIVEKLEIPRPRGRERTEAEWAKIIAVNKRTQEVRSAHHSRGPRLRREEYAGV